MENIISRIFIFLVLILLFNSISTAQSFKKEYDWKPFHFLLGEWMGEGSGEPGQGIGSFSFEFDLQKKIIIRKSSTSFQSTKDKNNFVFEDLTIIYKNPETSAVNAITFDNEGHVINYFINFSDDHNELIFLSNYSSNSPRYRITYSKINNQKLNVKFEIAPASKPDAFSVYYSGTAHRK